MEKPLKLRDAMELMGKRISDGEQIPFQIGFFTMAKKAKDFRLVKLPLAITCKLPQQREIS